MGYIVHGISKSWDRTERLSLSLFTTSKVVNNLDKYHSLIFDSITLFLLSYFSILLKSGTEFNRTDVEF